MDKLERHSCILSSLHLYEGYTQSFIVLLLSGGLSVNLYDVKKFKSYCSTVHFCRITSIYQPTNAHIISHKTLLKHFRTLRHFSILSDRHQGASFLAKVMLQYSQFISYLQTRCCGSISCCVGMCCGAVALYEAHRATAPQHIPTQHDMLPQHLVCKYEMNCEYCNITSARNKAP